MACPAADPRLSHESIIRHNGRPWPDADRMDEAPVANASARVGPRDTPCVLGDFTMGGSPGRVRSLRGRIRCGDARLVLGNHDKRLSQSGQETPFSSERDYLELKYDGRRVCMSHYPFLEWNGMYRGSPVPRGHIHSDGAYNEQSREAGVLRYDVGVDANGYYPVSLPEVLAFFGLG